MELKQFFEAHPEAAIAFSGGVDSAYLLYEAMQFGKRVKAYYVKTAFQPQFELEDAFRLAEELGTDMQVLEVDILCDAAVTANPANRCYHCKKILFSRILKAAKADGFIFGSPVHYAALSGALTSFMDRAFYGKGKIFRYKPAAGIVSARRGGTTAAFDQINKYFTISSMPVVSSKYWNMVHGTNPDEVRKDEEGMQVMRELGRNMAWLLKCIEAGRAAGIPDPVKEKPVMTNFIR